MTFQRRCFLRLGAVSAFASPELDNLFSSFCNAGAVPQSEVARGFEVEFRSMGSTINLRWIENASQSAEFVRSRAQLVAEKWVSILSDYEPDSETSLACEKTDRGEWVQVSDPLWNVLTLCDDWNRRSEGAFDAGLGALTRVRRSRRLPPSEKAWDAARERSGWSWIELDKPTKSFRSKKAGFRLDFGAVGKGIVVDAIAEELESIGIDRYIVNASGNMRMGLGPSSDATETRAAAAENGENGENGDSRTANLRGSGWPVEIDFLDLESRRDLVNAILHPEATSTKTFAKLKLIQCGLATSGDRWQRFPDESKQPSDSERKESSHIVDPKSKRGLAGHHQATVIAKSAAIADIVATATSVHMGRDPEAWLRKLGAFDFSIEVLILKMDDASDDLSVICNEAASQHRQAWQDGLPIQIIR